MTKEKNYYLVLVHGEDAYVVNGPLDIAEIDLNTLTRTKEDIIEDIKIETGEFIPSDSDITIIQLKKDKQGAESIKCHDVIFNMPQTTRLQKRLSAIFPEFAKYRSKAINNKERKYSIEETPKIPVKKEDGTTIQAGFDVFIYCFIKALTSNKQIKDEFLKKTSIISDHLKSYLLTDNPLENFNYQKIWNDLKQYKEVRALYLEYLNYITEDKKIINNRRVGYYRPFKKALKNLEEEKRYIIEKEKERQAKIEELKTKFKDGEISLEELIERIESIRNGEDIGIYLKR